MIYTITCNPALDYTMCLSALKTGAINRSQGENLAVGGKGINVSAVLRRLGCDSLATGFAAGFVGEEIVRLCAEEGIRTDFVRVPGCSRINVKLRAGEETDINGSGPPVPPDAYAALAEKLSALGESDMAVFAGSASPSLGEDAYAELMRRAGRAKLVADASGSLLRRAVSMRPWLVKPNKEELCELFGRPAESAAPEDIADMARALQKEGVQNVLVSLGAEGAFLLSESGEELFQPAFSGKCVDSVGAGDSMLAGFLAGKTMGKSDKDSLRLGAAAGAATAFRTGLAQREEILALFN